VLLRVETDDEGWDVDDLLADAIAKSVHIIRYSSRNDIPDVALADEDTSVVDGLGETELVDTGLEAALQEVLDLEGEHVIKLHAGLVEHTDTD
jgi:nucleoside-triphosphatase THEP1